MRFRLLYTQPLHQPPVLLRCELPRLLTVPRSLETPALQPLIHQHKPISLPVQPFEPILSPPTEQEQRILEWIQMKLHLHYPCQPVNPSPQVCVSAGQVHC